MYDQEKKQSFIWCQHCGSPTTWNVPEWVSEEGKTFCSWYCQENFAAFTLKMARKNKRI